MNLYSVDMKFCATAYIKANSEEEAMEIAKSMKDDGIELPENLEYLEIPISGRSYDDPELPDYSLSPAMTCHGAWDNDAPSLVESDIDEGTDDEDEDDGTEGDSDTGC